MANVKHLKTGDSEPSFDQNDKIHLLSMRFCPYAQRVHLVLNAKKIQYDTTNINLTNKPEWFTKYSPHGNVPALYLKNEAGKPWIYESLIVCDYLDEKYPEVQLYPKDAAQKAIDRLLIQRHDATSMKIFGLLFGRLPDTTTLEKEVFDAIDSFEVELKNRGTTFFGGSSPGMLDFMLWPIYERIGVLRRFLGDKYQFENKRYPKLVSILVH